MSAGKVYLVGAGPGDPSLITLRGIECLAEADVVLVDSLVDDRVLRHARPGAEIVPAGKHGGPGDRDREQAEIDARMIAEARSGRTVVRLKGGDPFVFGRGGEEALVLSRAAIAFEVVPGVTSAVAAPAYAGIPLTQRGVSSSAAIVTGHEAPGASRIDWGAVARIDTAVFLMTRKRLGEVLERLVLAGRDPSTPAACIERGTWPDQRVVTATVGTLAGEVDRAGIGTPSLVVVGEVVRLREEIRWLERRPLLGRTVLVTRPRAQAAALIARLEQLGAAVLEAPAIEIAPPESDHDLEGALARIGTFDWIVFTSRNGVEVFFDRLLAGDGDVRDLGRARLAAIGSETARALRQRGLRVEATPEEFRAEGLADRLAGEVRGKRVLLARAAGARDVLPRVFAAAGAEVTDAATYRSIPAACLPEATRRALAAGSVDAITFTSASTVESFVALAGGAGAMGAAAIACIGPITAATARRLGLRVAVEAREYTAKGLAAALVDYFSAPR